MDLTQNKAGNGFFIYDKPIILPGVFNRPNVRP